MVVSLVLIVIVTHDAISQQCYYNSSCEGHEIQIDTPKGNTKCNDNSFCSKKTWLWH